MIFTYSVLKCPTRPTPAQYSTFVDNIIIIIETGGKLGKWDAYLFYTLCSIRNDYLKKKKILKLHSNVV